MGRAPNFRYGHGCFSDFPRTTHFVAECFRVHASFVGIGNCHDYRKSAARPVIYTQDYLARLDPAMEKSQLTVAATEVDRLVINIAPFPTKDAFNVKYNRVAAANVFSIIGKLFSELLSRSRFFGEALTQVMNGTTFDRYVIAPSDQELVDSYKGKKPKDMPPSLQCATLGAFGGFFCRGFRAHDYALGRRNCQKFLQDWFALPQDNLMIHAGLVASGSERDTIVQNFGVPPPLSYNESAKQPTVTNRAIAHPKWLPVIPLCGTAADPIPPILRVTITGKMLDDTVDRIMQRFKAVMAAVLSNVRSTTLRLFLKPVSLSFDLLCAPSLRRPCKWSRRFVSVLNVAHFRIFGR